MHFTSLVAAASVASVALAAPAPLPAPESHLEKRSFKVVGHRGNSVRMAPKDAMAHAFSKHGMHWSLGDSGSTVSSTSSSSDATDSSDLLFPLSGTSTSGFASGTSGFGGRRGGGDAFRSWLSSIFAQPTGAPSAGSGSGSGSGSSSGTGSGSGSASSEPAPAPAAPTSSTAAEAPTAPSASSTVPEAPSGTGGLVGEAAPKPTASGSLYVTPVNIGGQTLNLDLDTGSADLWVFDSNSADKGDNKGFDSSASKSFAPIAGSSFEIRYGDGSTATGTVGTDVVSIGQVTVQKQGVEIATDANGGFQSDGLLGLGFSNVNSATPRQKTFFDNIKSQLKSPVFTATLNLAGNGEYEFGTIDDTKHTGEIQYTPVTSTQGYWQFPSTSFKVGDTVTQNAGAADAIADTGTSLCLVDDAAVEAYYAKVSGAALDRTQGGYTFPCGNGAATPPDFSVAIGSGGAYATIPGSMISYASIGGGKCFGGIQSNAGQQVQIFGDSLLQANFAVFDGTDGSPRFGIAPASSTPAGQ